MDEARRTLTEAFLFGPGMPEDAFVAGFGADLRGDPSVLLCELEEALTARDGLAVQLAVTLAHMYGLSRRWTPVLCALLDADWHSSHEDIAEALQDIRDPSTVEHLYRSAQRRHGYLDYNDSDALARKCIWALHDIGTPDAIARLEALTASETEPRTSYARERLAAIAARRPNAPPERYRLSRDSKIRPD